MRAQAFMFSVVIATIGIAMFLLFSSIYQPLGKSVYCDFMKLGFSYCKKPLKKIIVNEEIDKITGFNGRDVLNIEFNKNEEKGIKISLPKSKIINSSFSIEGSIEKIIDKFNGKDKIFFGYDGPESKHLTIDMPDGKIKEASMDITGVEMPPKMDLVFVVDTSDSMRDELNAICDNIKNILNKMLKKKLNTTVYIYVLSSQVSVQCYDKVITNSELKKTYPLSFTSTDFIEKYKEAYFNWNVYLSSFIYTYPDLANEIIENVKETTNNPALDELKNRYDKYKNKIKAYDSYDEAWGIGILWIAKNHKWRNNAKRFIFPVSDSDPTGGGAPAYSLFQDDGMLTGNEDKVIDKAIDAALAEDIKIFPIRGNEPEMYFFETLSTSYAKREGYNLGKNERECYSTYKNTCGKVVDLMKRIAVATKGNVTTFNNSAQLLNYVFKSITVGYPEDVDVKLNDKTIFNWTGKFKTKIKIFFKPKVGENTIDAFSKTESSLLLDELNIVYEEPMKDVSIKIDGNSIKNFNTLYNLQQVDLSNVLREKMARCDKDCDINLTISATKGKITIRNITTYYKKCFIDEVIAASFVNCLNSKNEFCYHIYLDEKCSNTADKSRIIKLINETSVCKRIDCNKIEIPQTNSFIIGYNPKLKTVIIK